MTLDGFLTFLTLAVAIYALAPPVAKLHAKLGLAIQIPVAVLAITLVGYLEFFQVFGQPCPATLGSVCDRLVLTDDNSFTPPQLAFLVVLIWMGVAWAIFEFSVSRLSKRSLPTLARLVDNLVDEQRFTEVQRLVAPYLPLLSQAASVSPQSRVETAASDILRVLFRSEALRRSMARVRPYFAISLLQLDVSEYERRDFSDAYFDDLISDTSSVLYQELEQNQQISGTGGYLLLESNRLLYFLFADAHTAENLQVWRPIGNHLLKVLRPGESPDIVASLNRGEAGFDQERWKDPVWAGIFFFDVMVTSAAYQGVRWHMWLYYFRNIVEGLVEIYDTSHPSVDTSLEFPTRSARLIYEALYALRQWVLLVSKLPEDSPHRQSDALSENQGWRWSPSFHDNGNIPVSASTALGPCMATIIMSDRIDERFAISLHEGILQTMIDLGRDWKEGRLRSLLIQSIVYGGQPLPDPRYVRRLITLLDRADYVLLHDVDDYRDDLRAVSSEESLSR